MSQISNIYYQPEEFGFEIVAEIDTEESHEYDKVVVWRNVETKRLYYGADSGCSCPVPFGDFKGVLDLAPLHVWADLIRLQDIIIEHNYANDAKIAFLTKVELLFQSSIK